MNDYPLATVACFDPTTGSLPRRSLDPQRLQQFLVRLQQAGAESVLIAASTGQGHLRSVAELEDFFEAGATPDASGLTRMALLRPEDGLDENERLLQRLKDLNYDVVFLRPGVDLDPQSSDSQVADSLRPLVVCAGQLGLPVGLYSISDVSGLPLTANAAAMLVDGDGGDAIVAVKVTEASYEKSTKLFFEHPKLTHLKVVQGWDPHLARALREDQQRAGITSGPMSLAVFQYLHILDAASRDDWEEVESSQRAVTSIFRSMQDDPTRFADLQRAKYIMGLGEPITASITEPQVERVFAALQRLHREADRQRMCKSLDLMGDGPFHQRLVEIAAS